MLVCTDQSVFYCMFNVCLINRFSAVLGRHLTSKVKTECAFFMQCNEVTVCADVHFHLSGSQCEVFLVCAGPAGDFGSCSVYVCVCVSLCYSRRCFTTSVRMAMSAFRAIRVTGDPWDRCREREHRGGEAGNTQNAWHLTRKGAVLEQWKREIYPSELMVCLI